MSSLLNRISELEKQLTALKTKIEKENKRWRSKEDWDIYWLVCSNGEPNWSYELNRDSDNFRYDTHNYFQTEEEAQKYASVLETERQLKKFADEHNDVIDWSNINQHKWCLYYNYKYYRVDIGNPCWSKDARTIFFSSKEIAEQAINEIGEEKITEYLTYEW